MMAKLDKLFIRKIVHELHGNNLDDTTAERIADTIASIARTFETIGVQSLFDMEPAHFNRILAELADGGESRNEN